MYGYGNVKNEIDLQNNEINGRHSFLLEYYTKAKLGKKAFMSRDPNLATLVESGAIVIIGQELMDMLEGLIDDLQDQKYYYDDSDADIRMDFIQNFCRHTKSPFYGVKFELLLWEKALIEAYYSFKDRKTGRKRFKKCILLVARKNGKSTFCAGLALAELIIGPGGCDIVCSSNDDAQADIIFQEIENMRVQFDRKGRRSHKNLQGIYNLRNKSSVKKLSDRTKNKEGRNIDFGIVDEVHEMTTNVIAKSIKQSQSTKPEPDFWEITTEGFVDDGYLDHELVYARKVIRGELEDPTLLAWLYTQDEESEIWADKLSHYKSNPSLGEVKQFSYIEGEIREAQQSKAARVFTLAKDFNIKQNNAEAWLAPEEFINPATYNMEIFSGCVALGGVDLAQTTDLACAKVLIMRPNDPTKYIITMYFIPEEKMAAGEIEDKKNYEQWAKDGLIRVTPGNENNFSLITQWFVELYKTWGIRFYKIGYDNALAKYWAEEMQEIGFELERIPQTFDGMSDPMNLVEADLKTKYINYNNNPIDRWCLGNTALKVNNVGKIMPVKVEGMRIKRIDGAVALIIAYAMYIRHRTAYRQHVEAA